jgi:hypothetical protein
MREAWSGARPWCGSSLATPEGFEPPTLGSEDQCSIQLSYGAVAWYCSTIPVFGQMRGRGFGGEALSWSGSEQVPLDGPNPSTSLRAGCPRLLTPRRRWSACSLEGGSVRARGARIRAVARAAYGSLRPNIVEAFRTFHNRRGAVLRMPVPCKASVLLSRTTIQPDDDRVQPSDRESRLLRCRYIGSELHHA